MQRSFITMLLAVVMSLAAAGVAARGDDLELTLAGGGTMLQVEGGGALDEQWGPWIAPGFSLAPFSGTPQLRLGGSVEFAWISADVDDEFISGQADLFLITPEFRVSWRQPLGERFYLEPGVGVGVVIGAFDVIGVEWGSGYSVRPFVRAAYDSGNWSTGIELAYRFGHLDFGESDGDTNNFNAGVFVSYKH